MQNKAANWSLYFIYFTFSCGYLTICYFDISACICDTNYNYRDKEDKNENIICW